MRGYPGPLVWLGLTVEPAAHAERITARARAQFDGGLIDEARALRERFDPALPAFSAIGYHEAWAVLDGELTTDAAVELDVRRNHAFVEAAADFRGGAVHPMPANNRWRGP